MSKKITVFFMVLLIILCVGGYAVLRKQSKDFVSISNPTPTMEISLTPVAESANTYTSQKLGISFSYPTVSWDITPHEVGSRIYFGIGAASQSQFIQVFHLSYKVNSIQEAIQKEFLTDISPKDCFVLVGGFKDNAPASFTTAIISFPGDTGSDNIPSQAAKCPQIYTHANANYFIMDPNHSDTLVFIQEGQQPLAGVGSIITKSIKILN